MSAAKVRMKDAGVMAATTIGAGIFSLPYVFAAAGLFVGFFYLIVLVCIVISVHILYFEVLKHTGGSKRLLGLAHEHLGIVGYAVSFAAIVGGLLLALVAYLILGGGFLSLIFPNLSITSSVIIFWLCAVAPLFMSERRLSRLEAFGLWFIALAVVFVFVKGFGNTAGSFFSLPLFVGEKFFLPFAGILFSLAGWTAIEPLFDEEKRSHASPLVAAKSLALGTLFAAFLYSMFVSGILGSVSHVTPDTVSGLVASGWPWWEMAIIGVLGLFAIWTSYVPVGIEIRNSLERDCRWKRGWSIFLIVLLPLVLVMSGFNNFLGIVGISGGMLLSLQYLIILLVGLKVLKPKGVAKWGFILSAAVFAFAAVFSILQFLH